MFMVNIHLLSLVAAEAQKENLWRNQSYDGSNIVIF